MEHQQIEHSANRPADSSSAPTIKPKQTINMKVVVALLVITVTGLAWFAWTWFALGNDSASNNSSNVAPITVSSFAECVAAGNPVQESYPERCVTPDGRSFTNPTQQVQTTQ